MPRRGDNISRTQRGRWRARKKIKLVIAGPHGPETRWKSVERTFDSHEDAKEWTREVERAEKSGEGWTDKRCQPLASLHQLAHDYAASAEKAGAPVKTIQFRDTMMGSWLDFLGGREPTDPPASRPVTELTRDLLAAFAESLPGKGPAATTRYRKVLEVEHMWAWAWEHHPEHYPGLPPKRRYTSGPNDADGLRKPPPVVAMAAPRWADVDAMIRHLKIDWHRHVALLARYTALRASQLTGLHWRDVDLNRGTLLIRAGVEGAKRGRTRVIPLHPDLARRMTTWPRDEEQDLLFVRRYTERKTGLPYVGPYRGDALSGPFRRAWGLSGVDRARWDKPENPLPGDRGHGRPVHCIRACIRTELIRSGVEEAIALYLVGHSQGITAAAYVPEAHPEESPYWPRMVAAISTIPAFQEQPEHEK
jgi:integrase